MTAPSSQSPDFLDDEKLLDWVQLSRTENIGPLTFRKLLQKFYTPRQILEALPHLPSGNRYKVPPRAAVEKEASSLSEFGGRFLCWESPEYPVLLKKIEDSPPVIAVAGPLAFDKPPTLGIVGARTASAAGKTLAKQLSQDMGERGYTICSGFARGIDTAAHEGSLATGTIAVLAGGIDHIYPPENKALYEKIKAEGALIAEAPFGSVPQARHFPKRNRIIAGLSSGILVVEAALRSGSLITATLGAQYGREIFAVPGHPLDPRCQGTNKLLKEGATFITEGDDICAQLQHFHIKRPRPPLPVPSSPPPIQTSTSPQIPTRVQEKIINCLSNTPISLDELIRECHVSASIAQNYLLELELSGQVLRLPGGKLSLNYTT